MLNAMSQGRSGSMCTIHSDSSAGVFRRIASYAVQAPERLPLEASNLLIAGAIHFVVHLDSELLHDHGASGLASDGSGHPSDRTTAGCHFPSASKRERFVSSVREVVDAEGVQVISNEIYRPGPDRRAVAASPIRPETVRELRLFGYEPSTSDAFGMLT
jgi:hypothetical protein